LLERAKLVACDLTEDGDSWGSCWEERPNQMMAADIDMTWNLESLPIQWMRMSSEGRPGSTCLTSNRKVLGPRLPSIAIVPHATITFWMGYRGWRPSRSLLERSSLNRPKMIVCSLRVFDVQPSRLIIPFQQEFEAIASRKRADRRMMSI
jgi:hypothetical protein